MGEMTFNAKIENGRLIIDLPDDMPEGPVEVVVRAVPAAQPASEPLTLQRAKEILRAAGKLVEITVNDSQRHNLSAHEIKNLGELFLGDRPSHELIDEDRGEY